MSDPRTAAPRFRYSPLAAAFLLAAGLVGAAAQPPEQFDPKGGAKTKVTAEDGPEPKPVHKPGTAPRVGAINPPDVRLDEIARQMETAQNKDLKAFYARFVVPFDQLAEKGGATHRVRPFFRLWGKDEFPRGKAFQVVELDAKNAPAVEPKVVEVAEVRKLDPFELVVVGAVDQWLQNKPPSVTTDDQRLAAEAVLAAALRFHEYARKTKASGFELHIRNGKAWDAVRTQLADKLREVRLLPLAEAEEELKKPVPDFDRVRVLLDRVEAKLPDKGGAAGDRVRARLSDEAGKIAKRVLERLKVGAVGQDLAKDAALARRLDPAHPDVRALQDQMKGTGYSVLVVAVRQFPQRMTPGTARFDSEKQAVELLFEGLLDEVPGEGGVRYRPGAAAEVPAIQPGGRAVVLGPDRWAFPDQGALDPHDVVGTLRLMRARPDLWPAAGLPWLEDLPTPTPGGVRIGFRMSHPDPRALLTFKVLPARWLAERQKTAEDVEFAETPWGTGPYRLDLRASRRREGDTGRELVFAANEGYQRPGRTDQPEIREIRFVEMAKLGDLAGEFRFDRLHILPDVPTAELGMFDELAGKGAGGRVRVVTAAANRRVHILAINHRKAYLQNKDLRRGLSLGVDREAVLNDVFRAGRPEFHRPMSGPFPPRTWAEKLAAGEKPPPLGNRDLAAGKIRSYLADKTVTDTLRLAFAVDERYPEDLKQTDHRKFKSQTGQACGKIKEQIEALFKDGGGRRLTIALEPLTGSDLFRRVQDEHQYDLAYLPFDYPDDWYPFGLAAFLDPTATGRGGRNCTGYLGPEARVDADDTEIGTALRNVTGTRDYIEKVPPTLRTLQDKFVIAMPFVPLWQLDRHTVVHRAVEVDFGDADAPPANAEEAAARQVRKLQLLHPTVLFQGVGRWRVK